MGQFQLPVDPSTVWLRGLIEAMDKVALSDAQPSAIDRRALANRLELPAMPAPSASVRLLIHPANPIVQGTRLLRRQSVRYVADDRH